jgi:2-amino-4-hydroxy-6-hydroxymethyldihydropteridine diphosphokinase
MQRPEPIEAFVALGSNLGDSSEIIRAAFLRLEKLSRVPIRCSSLWRTAPVDCPPGSPDFLNAVVALEPIDHETPETLLPQLRQIEIEFGRRPKVVHNEPRPLDLDLIAFGQEVRKTPELILPHPRAQLRGFVLVPLAELAPRFVLPGQTTQVAELALPYADQVRRVG